MPRAAIDRALRAATIAIAATCSAFGLVAPGQLVGGASWLIALICALAGWGHLLARASRDDAADAGLRLTWGLSGIVAIVGPLIAAGVASRAVLLVLIAIGMVAFAWHEIRTETPAWRHATELVRRGRAHPVIAAAAVVIGALVVLRIANAVVQLDRNPWDDDLAYTPLVKRLLDCGDLIEPFSLRRLASLGGQTALQALAGARGALDGVHLLDHGLGFLAFVLLVLGHARVRGTSPWWVCAVALAIAVMPDTSINTAAHWTGAALLFGMYRNVAAGMPVHAALVGAAACTLRQSYLPIVVMFLAGAAVMQIGSRRSELRTWLRAAAVFLLVLGPWLLASWRATGAMLFPLQSGTLDDAVPLQASLGVIGQLELLGRSALESGAFAFVPFLALVLFTTSDQRAGRPLTALFAAVTAGFVLLVVGFSGSEPAHLWRYAFGPAMALGVAAWLEVVSAARSEVEAPELARWLAILALAAQLVTNRGASLEDLRRTADRLITIESRDDRVAARYREAQSAIPAGERVAVMVDEPRHLDFSRNTLFNLDTPGFAGPDGGLPSFTSAAAWRGYLVDQRVRYVIAVRSESSVAFFRRPFWVWRIFNDSDLFQAMSAYTIDAIDTIASIAREGRVVFDREGIVVIDLGTDARPMPAPARAEDERRAAYIRSLAEKEHLRTAWSISSRDDALFAVGFSGLIKPERAIAHDGILPPPLDETRPARWIMRRALIRVRGSGSSHVALHGELNPAIVARPTLSIRLDGDVVARVTPDDRGSFAVDATVTVPHGEWADLELVWSSAADPAADGRELRIARLLGFTWEPAR